MSSVCQPSTSNDPHSFRKIHSTSTHGIKDRRRSSFYFHSERRSISNQARPNQDSFTVQTEGHAHSSNRSSEDSDLLKLTNKAWRIYQVSPLFGFKYNATSLKQYSRLLLHDLKSSRFGLQDIRYDVKLTILKGLKCTSVDESALQIEVSSLADGLKPVTLYLGILLSWGMTNKCQEGFVHLPLLLGIGAVRTIDTVHKMLCKFFDCSISPLEMGQIDLMWLSAISNVNSDKKYKNSIQFHYKCPQVMTGKICASLPVQQVNNLWEKIHDIRIKQVLENEVFEFHNVIGNQFKMLNKSDSGQIVLSQFDMPIMSATTEGKIKLRSVDAVEFALTYLCSIAIILESPVPNLSVAMIY